MDERRKRMRGRCLVGARVVFNNRTASLGCIVRNQTKDGCMLTFGETPYIPNMIELLFDNRKEFILAKVCWRDEKRVGVSFIKDEDVGDASDRFGLSRLSMTPQKLQAPHFG